MSNSSESLTSIITAIARASHQLVDSEPKIFHDPIAAKILGPEMVTYIQQNKETIATNVDNLRIRSHIVLRTRYTEDRLREAVGRGVTQFVILGAGLDTFGYRQPEWARRLSIFEVDLPHTQAAKQERLRNADIAIPVNLKFIQYDPINDPIGQCLINQGVSLEEPTFFSWLGVTMYLEETEVDDTLKAIASYPSGSEIVLTYLPPKDFHSLVGQVISESVSRVGEAFKSTFTSKALKKKLNQFGYSNIQFISAHQARDWYYSGGRHYLPVPVGPESGEISIASAIR